MQDLASEAMEESAAGGEFNSMELSLENKTKEILEKIVGVGAVDVLVTIDSTEEVVVQRNVKDTQELTEESDADGGGAM